MKSNLSENSITQKDQSRSLLIGLVLILIAVAFVFAIYFLLMSSVNPRKTLPNMPSPTVFILHNTIRSLSPNPESNNVSLYASISAKFTSSINVNQAEISLNPAILGNISWSKDNTTITFTPSESFTPSTTYEATLRFPEGKQIWRFTIASSKQVTDQDAMRRQMESDIETAESLSSFYKEFPWWESFPLRTDRYFVYFNPKRKIFIGLLYPKKSSSVDQQINSMKKEIQTKIENMKIKIDDYGIEWKVTPEP